MGQWTREIAGFFALGLFVAAGAYGVPASRSGVEVVWALGGVAGLGMASYLWRRWWLSMVVSVAAAGLVLKLAASPHVGILIPIAALAALAGWWATLSLRWPLKPWQALLAVGLLVLVSLTLSGLLALNPVPAATRSVPALVVLYLSTPPWEWAVVLTALAQARYLRGFVETRYRWTSASWRHAAMGFATGIGLILVVALVVSLETQGFHVHVISNNPFINTPGLKGRQWGAALAIAFGVIILAPFAEEALFRGILFGSLSERWGYGAGSAVSAAIFGFAHLDWTLFVPLALAGAVLNALYRRSGSLIPSTVAHMTLNAVSVITALGAMR